VRVGIKTGEEIEGIGDRELGMFMEEVGTSVGVDPSEVVVDWIGEISCGMK
jgi:hypothetical protein